MNAFKELLKSKANYVIIIHIGRQPDFQEFCVHSVLFCVVSPIILIKNFLFKTLGNKDGKCVIKKPDFTPQAFEVIIK